MDRKNWLDVLTDGQIMRDWFSLIAQFFMGMAYLSFLMAGFAVALSLSVVLVGIPLLLFMLGSVRTLAAMDRRMFGGIIDVQTDEVEEDLDLRGANLGERLGMMLGSGRTWLSLVYLLMKFPIGIFAFMASMFILPFLAIEVLILAPLTIDMRLITVRALHWTAVGLHRFPGMLLPNGKRKRPRDVSRLETTETAEPQYYIDDDGELMVKRKF